MGECEQLHFRREQLIELFESERAVVAHRSEAKTRADPFCQNLPRHEVAMVLHLGEQNNVARPDKLSAPCLRNEVDTLRSPASEHDLIRARRADVLRDACPSRFVGLSRARAQLAESAMNIRVVGLVV